MIKLDNNKLAVNFDALMQQRCGPSTNCNACLPSGCSCSKCFDSVADVNKIVKKVYSK